VDYSRFRISLVKVYYVHEKTNYNMNSEIRAIALINNSVSADVLEKVLLIDNIKLEECYVVKLRASAALSRNHPNAFVQPAVGYSIHHLFKLAAFYFNQRSAIDRLLGQQNSIAEVYIVNADNLLCAHIINKIKVGLYTHHVRLSVLAEGFMNYQDITASNRSAVKNLLKLIGARLLGIRYTTPKAHLSGSYESCVHRVFGYWMSGLKAPAWKATTVPLPRVEVTVTPVPNSALIIMTGIHQWMSAEDFSRFKQRFIEWVQRRNFSCVYVKAHPNYKDGGIEAGLRDTTRWGDGRPLEKLAGEIPSATVIGFCTTALATIRQIRSDLEVIDWGSDLYVDSAYAGDTSVVTVLNALGVRLVRSDD